MEPWVCLQGIICMNTLWREQRGGGEEEGNSKQRSFLMWLFLRMISKSRVGAPKSFMCIKNLYMNNSLSLNNSTFLLV